MYIYTYMDMYMYEGDVDIGFVHWGHQGPRALLILSLEAPMSVQRGFDLIGLTLSHYLDALTVTRVHIDDVYRSHYSPHVAIAHGCMAAGNSGRTAFGFAIPPFPRLPHNRKKIRMRPPRRPRPGRRPTTLPLRLLAPAAEVVPRPVFWQNPPSAPSVFCKFAFDPDYVD